MLTSSVCLAQWARIDEKNNNSNPVSVDLQLLMADPKVRKHSRDRVSSITEGATADEVTSALKSLVISTAADVTP